MTVLGAPCVAQRVWPIPTDPVRGVVSSLLSSSPIFPAAFRMSRSPLDIVAIPAES